MLMSKEEQREETGVVYSYELTTETIDDGGDMRYTTYGISVVGKEQTVVCSYRDVSTNQAFVERIIQQCNRLQADPMHLEDILIDSIG